MKEYQSWKSIYTKNKNPELIFQKEYRACSEARKIEISLKKAKSRIIIEHFISWAVR